MRRGENGKCGGGVPEFGKLKGGGVSAEGEVRLMVLVEFKSFGLKLELKALVIGVILALLSIANCQECTLERLFVPIISADIVFI